MKTRTLYLLGAVLIIILAGLAAITPDFGSSPELSGSAGQALRNSKNRITSPAEDLALMAGDTLKVEWQAEKGQADLYLVPETKGLKLVTIAKAVEGYSFTYVTPADLKPGTYYIVVNAGQQIKGQSKIDILN